MKRVTIELTDQQFDDVRAAYRDLRAARARQGRGSHPLAQGGDAALRWFLAAALTLGADQLAEQGPG